MECDRGQDAFEVEGGALAAAALVGRLREDVLFPEPAERPEEVRKLVVAAEPFLMSSSALVLLEEYVVIR